MDDIGIYREGGLPPFSRSFHKIDLRILHCSFWNVYYWQHDTLMAPYWRIYWNDRSGASISFKGMQYDLEPGLIFLIPPDTSYGSKMELNKRREDMNFLMGCSVQDNASLNSQMKYLKHLFIHFTLGLPSDRISPHIYKIEVSREISNLISRISGKLSNPSRELDMQSVFSIQALINLLLITIPEDHWPGEIVDERVKKVIDYIEKYYFRQIQNRELSELVHMSDNGFSRLFKNNTGKSPKDYLIERRLDHACNMLHHSNYSIDEVASLCGFCDRSYFSRMFIKKYSTGPAKFKKTAFINK
jgi:AraC-like DNA-binding protein